VEREVSVMFDSLDPKTRACIRFAIEHQHSPAPRVHKPCKTCTDSTTGSPAPRGIEQQAAWGAYPWSSMDANRTP
jgi:hypothetical protein